MKARLDILSRREDIIDWINAGQSKAFISKELNCKQQTLNRYLKQMDIEYAGNQGGKGIKTDPKYKTAEEYAKGASISSSKLKDKLVRDGIREDKCEICGISEWQGIKLSLELHHKDGNHYNNEFANLIILCPNCHSIQEIHKQKLMGNYPNQAQGPD